MTVKALISLVLGLATITACANSSGVRPAATAEASVGAPARQELTAQILYQYLLGEIAAQRGELAVAAEAMLDLAVKTRDARIAQRATELAIFARRPAQALRAAQLWVEREPNSARARQTYISLLLGAGRLNDARPQLEAFLRLGELGAGFLQLPQLLLRHQDKQAVLTLMSELAAAYPSLPEASLALAQVAWHAAQSERALTAVDEALRLRPGWESAALFKGQILQRRGEDEAVAYWQGFLARHPDARQVRQLLARQLARMGRFAAARAHFEVLHAQDPAQVEHLVALGLMAQQMSDWAAAERYYLQALDSAQGDADQLRLYLGQVAEAQRRHDQALKWYLAVGEGRHYLDARMRAAVLLGKLGRIDEGRRVLAALPAESEAERVQLIQTEAQMLREAKDYQAMFDLLSRALEAMPDSPELLYDRAMAAERLNRLDVLEQDLRRLIALKPDHAHAYNALGYTLADRTERIAEAIELLEVALKLAPDDPFILDSMGWALFKARRLNEAIDYLRRAYSLRADPEIAAHLGEALWVRGDREEARRIWQGSLREHPDNESLRETVGRLLP
ncbi:MAG: tetratricopeptide repeat protein [Thiobacillaceae bacterium]|nr:tetratricopeptide repeat protein [Thiobacillaceae bacterium]MCX7672971.1 tetratricopeptide repeat protein [Thiobacillaceae bacterium]MDW8324526.1 tetratricopeptide repeat protein [Burkholderiales bacterium]